jgi:WD40 repeat protein
VAWSPNGEHLAGADANSAALWQLDADPPLATTLYRGDGQATAVAWSPDGRSVLVNGFEGVTVVDVETRASTPLLDVAAADDAWSWTHKQYWFLTLATASSMEG